MMIVEPLGDKVLIELKEIEEKSDSGIVLHTQHQQNREQEGQFIGTVIDLGPLIHHDVDDMGDTPEECAATFGYKIGDVVIVHRYDGEKTGVPGYDNHRIITGNMIIGKVKEQP